MKFLSKKIILLLITFILMALAIGYSTPADVISTIFSKLIYILPAIIIIFILNFLVVTLRFGIMLRAFSVRLPWLTIAKANISGYVASMFIFSIFGQVLGRDLILKKNNVPSVIITTVSLYERLLMFFIGAFFCFVGTIFVFGIDEIFVFLKNIPIPQILIIFSLLVFLLFKVGLSRYEKIIFGLIEIKSILKFLLVSSGVTIMGQALMLSIFVVTINYLFPDVQLLLLFSAAAMISFIASVPISVNGWGVREVGSIGVLSALGISSSNAIAISIFIGVSCTIGVYFIFFILNLLKEKRVDLDNHFEFSENMPWVATICLWFLIIATAFFIFFQVHVPVGNYGKVNVNLADPFALFAGVLLLLLCTKQRRFPVWSYSKFNRVLFFLTCAILLSFLNGIFNIGFTSWAFNNRLFGWVVILSYLATGYLCVAVFGKTGFRRFLEVLAFTAVFVIVTVYISRIFVELGYVERGAYNFEGFSSNRNAFAFQMLVVLSAIFSVCRIYIRRAKNENFFWGMRIVWLVSASIVTLGIIFSGSRTAYIVLFFLVLFVFVFAKRNEKKLLLVYLGITFISLQLTNHYMSYMQSSSSLNYRGGEAAEKSQKVFTDAMDGLVIDLGFVSFDFNNLSFVQSMTSQIESVLSNSDAERWVSIIKGFEVWLDYPVLGGGLGYFIESSKAWWGDPLVIHSTPVWVMAEFGLVGIIGLFTIFICLLMYVFKRKNITPIRTILPMMLIIFFLYGLVHDIFYQRIFWLMLGAVMAVYNISHSLKFNKKSFGIDSLD